jgi:hypothetical protein
MNLHAYFGFVADLALLVFRVVAELAFLVFRFNLFISDFFFYCFYMIIFGSRLHYISHRWKELRLFFASRAHWIRVYGTGAILTTPFIRRARESCFRIRNLCITLRDQLVVVASVFAIRWMLG